jgi:hypothetical protein
MLEPASPRKLTLLGIIAVGTAVAVSSFGIVRAERADRNDRVVFRCDQGVSCVEGHATGRSVGVLGISAAAEGEEGVTFAVNGKPGVRGASRGTSGLGYGVIGTSTNGDGVVGRSSSTRSAGVLGISEKGDGVVAESAGTDRVALHAHADTPTTAIFFGHNHTNHAQCLIDPNANLSCTGNIGAGSAVTTVHRNGTGQSVTAYTPESATATIEDVGTGRMADGVANVRFDSAFAAMTDHRWYFVFLTPLGDTRGLYVSRKTASGFQVRETEHGKANLEFDYRVVAHPVDAPDDRLPAASR